MTRPVQEVPALELPRLLLQWRGEEVELLPGTHAAPAADEVAAATAHLARLIASWVADQAFLEAAGHQPDPAPLLRLARFRLEELGRALEDVVGRLQLVSTAGR